MSENFVGDGVSTSSEFVFEGWEIFSSTDVHTCNLCSRLFEKRNSFRIPYRMCMYIRSL